VLGASGCRLCASRAEHQVGALYAPPSANRGQWADFGAVVVCRAITGGDHTMPLHVKSLQRVTTSPQLSRASCWRCWHWDARVERRWSNRTARKKRSRPMSIEIR